mgnify:CR=1 FL=1
MYKGERIYMIIVMICFIISMWVGVFKNKSNNERFDKIEKELHELKTK